MRIATTIGLLMLCMTMNAQLAGEYTIGGSNPDYSDIPSAIAALESEGISAAVDMYIRSGTYEGSFTIGEIAGTAIDSRVTLRSESGDPEDVILTSTVADAEDYIWRLGDVSFLTFKDLTFDNQVTSDYGAVSIGSEYDDVNDLEIIGCRFLITDELLDYSTHLGFWPQVGRALVQDNYFGPAQDGLYMAGGSDLTIKDNHFDISDDMVEFEAFDSVFVQGNVFNGLNDDWSSAIIGYDFIDYCLITENEFTGSIDYLIDIVDGSSSIEILNNHINVEVGNDAEMDIEFCEHLVAVGNTMESGSEYLLYVEEADYVFVSNNQLSAIWTNDCRGDVVVEFNEVIMTDRINDGIEIDGQTLLEGEALLIHGNSLQGGTGYSLGIVLEYFVQDENSMVVVSNNELKNCSEAFEFSNIDHALISFNSISTTSPSSNDVIDAYEVGQIEFSNNIVHLGNETISADIVNSATLDFWNAHHNVYFWNAAELQIDYYSENLLNFHSLEDAQANGFETSSIFVNPEFYNDSLDLRICNADLQGIGVDIPEIETDYFGIQRPASPTPGYYEFQELSADFDYSQDQSLISLEMENCSSAENILWDFGDGSSSALCNPSHFYSSAGSFTVSLTVTNPCGLAQMSTQLVLVGSVGLDDVQSDTWNMYPNPTQGFVNIVSTMAMDRIEIMDLTGRFIQAFTVENKDSHRVQLDLSGYPSGTYFLSITSEHGQNRSSQRVLLH